MKKYIGSIFLLALFACGGEEEGSGVNSEGTSSLVAGEATGDAGSTSEQTLSAPILDQGVTSIEYIEVKHDFGNVRYPSENLYTFKFKNTGDTPLVIESAQASCGCTVPNKPEEPIAPGEIGEMDVIFKPKEGQQGQIVTKKVTVTANTSPKQTYLEITANVLAPMGS